MARIDKTEFGSIIINGKKFNSDMIICWDGELRERTSSHNFTEDELHDLLLKEPEVIVVGTGTAGLMKIDQKTELKAKKEGIELISNRSHKAIQDFNNISKTKKAIALIHVTC